MTIPCQDRNLLSIEPCIFLDGGFRSQQLVGGSDGVLSGTTFSSAGSDFSQAAVQAGMVLTTYATVPSEGIAVEIITVDSATALTVSLLRASTDDDALPPPAGTNLKFHIRTFAPQIEATHATLCEVLRQISEASGVSTADFADSSQLRMTIAYGALSSVFVARAANADACDANWIKAEHYRGLFRRFQSQLRLAVDTDGDGVAEETRTLGNITLRRV